MIFVSTRPTYRALPGRSSVVETRGRSSRAVRLHLLLAAAGFMNALFYYARHDVFDFPLIEETCGKSRNTFKKKAQNAFIIMCRRGVAARSRRRRARRRRMRRFSEQCGNAVTRRLRRRENDDEMMMKKKMMMMMMPE